MAKISLKNNKKLKKSYTVELQLPLTPKKTITQKLRKRFPYVFASFIGAALWEILLSFLKSL
jgi:hypothetical protein